MRTLRYYVAVTIDGFIAREDGTFDFFPEDGALIADFFASLKTDFDAVVMGRATYEVGLAQGLTNPYPWLDTYLVSQSLSESPDDEVTLLRDVQDVASLKDRDGGRIWLCGGGQLASALQRAGLIDELVLKTSPVILGQGIPLFRGLERPLKLEPKDAPKHYDDSGIVVRRFACG